MNKSNDSSNYNESPNAELRAQQEYADSMLDRDLGLKNPNMVESNNIGTNGNSTNSGESGMELTTSLTLNPYKLLQSNNAFWWSNVKSVYRRILNSWTWTMLSGAMVLLALFADDLKIIIFNAQVDKHFDIFYLLLMGLFILEMVGNAIVKSDYFLHFYFWLDLIATITMPIDLSYVWNAINELIQESLSQGSDQSRVAQATTAGQATSKASKILRVIRVVRLIRIAKLCKGSADQLLTDDSQSEISGLPTKLRPGQSLVYPRGGKTSDSASVVKTVKKEHQHDKNLKQLKSKPVFNPGATTTGQPASRVGRTLSDLTTQKIIVIVLTLLIIQPLLHEDTWLKASVMSSQYAAFVLSEIVHEYIRTTDPEKRAANFASYEYGVMRLVKYHMSGSSVMAAEALEHLTIPFALQLNDNALTQLADDISVSDAPLLRLKTLDVESKGISLRPEEGYDPFVNLRYNERYVQYVPVCTNIADIFYHALSYQCKSSINTSPKFIQAVFSSRPRQIMASAMTIVKSIVVCFILTLATMLMTNDAQRLVLNPIDRMVAKIQKLQKNPLMAVQFSYEQDNRKCVQLEKGLMKEIKKTDLTLDAIWTLWLSLHVSEAQNKQRTDLELNRVGSHNLNSSNGTASPVGIANHNKSGVSPMAMSNNSVVAHQTQRSLAVTAHPGHQPVTTPPTLHAIQNHMIAQHQHDLALNPQSSGYRINPVLVASHQGIATSGNLGYSSMGMAKRHSTRLASSVFNAMNVSHMFAEESESDFFRSSGMWNQNFNASNHRPGHEHGGRASKKHMLRRAKVRPGSKHPLKQKTTIGAQFARQMSGQVLGNTNFDLMMEKPSTNSRLDNNSHSNNNNKNGGLSGRDHANVSGNSAPRKTYFTDMANSNYEQSHMHHNESEYPKDEDELGQMNIDTPMNKLKPLGSESEEEPYETAVLEQTVVKLGSLLAIGFGEAGGNIISKNFSNNGRVDPMIPGRKVQAVFGFCDIRYFTDVTEVLREKVLLFVNQIADIVHTCVDCYGGSANKNIGDAFLVIWRLKSDSELVDEILDKEEEEEDTSEDDDEEEDEEFEDASLVSRNSITSSRYHSYTLPTSQSMVFMDESPGQERSQPVSPHPHDVHNVAALTSAISDTTPNNNSLQEDIEGDLEDLIKRAEEGDARCIRELRRRRQRKRRRDRLLKAHTRTPLASEGAMSVRSVSHMSVVSTVGPLQVRPRSKNFEWSMKNPEVDDLVEEKIEIQQQLCAFLNDIHFNPRMDCMSLTKNSQFRRRNILNKGINKNHQETWFVQLKKIIVKFFKKICPRRNNNSAQIGNVMSDDDDVNPLQRGNRDVSDMEQFTNMEFEDCSFAANNSTKQWKFHNYLDVFHNAFVSGSILQPLNEVPVGPKFSTHGGNNRLTNGEKKIDHEDNHIALPDLRYRGDDYETPTRQSEYLRMGSDSDLDGHPMNGKVIQNQNNGKRPNPYGQSTIQQQQQQLPAITKSIMHSANNNSTTSPTKPVTGNVQFTEPNITATRRRSSMQGIELENHERQQFINKTCDLALVAFLKVQTCLRKSVNMLDYRKDENIKRRVPNFNVSMGFGLHVGWAIEGAIGSSFKIDASYLSPNVNMAARLEAATKQYGVPLLISGALAKRLSPGVFAYTRQIDCVTVKGSVLPIDLYTVDVLPENIPVDLESVVTAPSNVNLSLSEMRFIQGLDDIYKLKHSIETRQKIAMEKKKMMSPRFEASTIFQCDPDIVALTGITTKEFTQTWKMGFNAYIHGRWDRAKEYFLITKDLLKKRAEVAKEKYYQRVDEINKYKQTQIVAFRKIKEYDRVKAVQAKITSRKLNKSQADQLNKELMDADQALEDDFIQILNNQPELKIGLAPCFDAVKEDGPTNALLNYMKEYNFVAPKEWSGFRNLTEK